MLTQNHEQPEADDGDAEKKEKDTIATTKETELNLEKNPKNKIRRFRTLPSHKKTKKLIHGSNFIAKIHP